MLLSNEDEVDLPTWSVNYTGMLMYVVYHIHMYDICMHFDIIITYIHVYIDMNTRAQTHTRTQMRMYIYVCLPLFSNHAKTHTHRDIHTCVHK